MKLQDKMGFSLIELLIVVSIISILAGIAVPNFLDAQTRSKVSRIKSDMRVIASSLEAYAVDHNTYPVRNHFPYRKALDMSEQNPNNGIRALPDTMRRAEDLSALTTPIAYQTSLFEDIFEQHVEYPNKIIDYSSPDLTRFMIKNSRTRDDDDQSFGFMVFSMGPDGRLGVTNSNGNYPVREDPTTLGDHWEQEYDPTNGTISIGNITRFQKQGATATNAFKNPPRN